MKMELLIFLAMLTRISKGYSTELFGLIMCLMITVIVKSNLHLTNKYRLYTMICSVICLGLIFIFNDDLTNHGRTITWFLKGTCVFSFLFLGIQQSYYNKNVLLISILPGIFISIIGVISQLKNIPIDHEIKQYIPLANNLFDYYSFVIKNNLLTAVILETPFEHFIFALSVLLTNIENILLVMGIYFYINYFIIKAK